MTKTIHEGPIDAAAIRQWGYDEDMLFCDQDEDLFLGDECHFPALAELAKDADCPKAAYALFIIDFRLMFQTLCNPSDAAAAIESALRLFPESTLPLIGSFREVNRVRLELLSGVGEVSRETALRLGTAALNGVARNAEITVSDGGATWVVQLSVQPFHLHKEWLTLDKRSGRFSFHR